MGSIKKFDEFINEVSGWGSAIVGQLDAMRAAARARGEEDYKPEKPDKITGVPAPSNLASSSSAPSTPASTSSSATSSLAQSLGSAADNDDFILYMQHQQGLHGAKGLLAAATGRGKLATDTIKTKEGVRYANLYGNVPDDRKSIRTQMVSALNAGDQRTAATLFLKVWKEKWMSLGKEAKVKIQEPKYAKLKATMQKYCSQYSVPFDFAVTVAYIESRFYAEANRNKKTQYKGLFQLNNEEFKKYVPGGDIFNMDQNCRAGIKKLRDDIKNFTKLLGPLLANIRVSSWATV